MKRTRNSNAGGEIFRFSLEDWWFSSFDEAEREWMAITYTPMGTAGRPLIEGDMKRTEHSPYPFLTGAAVWLSKEDGWRCAHAFLDKSEEFYSEKLPIYHRHFGMAHRCKVYHRWREHDDFALEMAVDACRRAMGFHREAALAFAQDNSFKDLGIMPSHLCMEQLAIIEEKRGNLDEALSIAREALAAGWFPMGWKKRIASLERKLASKNPSGAT